MRPVLLTTALLAATLCALPAHAEDAVPQMLILKNHAFVPQDLTVPAGQKIKLTVKNEDAAAAEFESFELNREKVVPANGQIDVYIGPLDAGTYKYFDDFHRDTTTGTIVAK